MLEQCVCGLTVILSGMATAVTGVMQRALELRPGGKGGVGRTLLSDPTMLFVPVCYGGTSGSTVHLT